MHVLYFELFRPRLQSSMTIKRITDCGILYCKYISSLEKPDLLLKVHSRPDIILQSLSEVITLNDIVMAGVI